MGRLRTAGYALMLLSGMLFIACKGGGGGKSGGTVNNYNVNLASLDISDGTLSPLFDQTVTGYSVDVAYAVDSITIDAESADAAATVAINSGTAQAGSASADIALTAGGTTTVRIVVTAPDGVTAKTYSIAIARAAEPPVKNSNPNLSGIALSSGTITPAFNPNTTNYRAEIASTAETITITPTAAFSATTIKIGSETIPSGAVSSARAMNVGINKVQLNTIAEDGVTTKTYYLELVRVPDKSKNAYLSELYLSAGTLSPLFAKNITGYTAEVAEDVSSITVTPGVPGVNAVCKVNGAVVASHAASASIALASGANTITVEVTAEDPSSYKKYTVTVNRLAAASVNADLAGLTANGGTLNPAFDPTVTSYTLYTNGTGYTLTPVSAGVGSSIAINGTAIASGTASAELGNATNAEIVVTAAGGAAKTYTVTAVADNTAPVLGALRVQKRETKYINIEWDAATDDRTASDDISYAVYRSSSNNITTIADAEINGTLVCSYTRNMLISNIVGLSPNTLYYFAIVSRDLAGNRAIAILSAASAQVSVFNSALPNSTVNSIVENNGIIYVGGRFTAIGRRSENNAVLSISTAEPDETRAPGTNNEVQVSITDGEGGWYIGGRFTMVNGILRNRIAHIQADGVVDEWNANAGGTVSTLAISGSTVYAGGNFTSIGGQTRNYIAALDTATGNATAWNPNASNQVNTLAVSGSTVYAGGWFTSIGGQARNKIAALDAATGNATAWNPNANSNVNTIAISGSMVYAGGNFTSIGGQTRNYIAALDAVTGELTAWNPNASNQVYTLAVSGGVVYAGGRFTSIGGQARNYIAALDAATGDATAWNPNASNLVYTLAVSGGTVYAGGWFTSIGGQMRNGIAALDAVTGNATVWNPNPGGSVYTIAISGRVVYAGGNFATIGGQTRNRIAALDAATGSVTAWNPDIGGDYSVCVNAIAVSGKTVYAGGYFKSIGGQTRNNIAALDAATGSVTAWNPDIGGDYSVCVNAIAVSGKTVYAGGYFKSIGGQTRNNIAALDAVTGNATAWNPNANYLVSTLAVSGSTVYAGGDFSTIGGQTRNNIAALDAVTGNATAWNPNAGGLINALAVSGGTVYVGGEFVTIGGQTRFFIAALDAATGLATAWNPNASYYVYTIAVSGSTVYAGGGFTTIGGQARKYIAALDAVTGTATAWNPNASNQVNTLAVSGSTVYAGGLFDQIGGQMRNGMAALDVATGNATACNPNVNDLINAIAVSGSTVYVGGSFTEIGNRYLSRFAAVDAVTGEVR